MSFPLPPRPRRSLEDFGLGRELGDGSLATVRLATEHASGRRYALKMFCRQHLRSNHKEGDVTMEEHCLRRLNHPGIVKLYTSFRDNNFHYIALELCPGGELWELVKDVGCSDRVARHYLLQVLEAVAYLRDAGIVHRDLKAENVLLSERGAAKLVDFGSAKDLECPHVKGAGNQHFRKVLEDNVGTPNFMAPEVINNKFSDFRSDMWSFGCMVFQVVTGLPPFGTNIIKVYSRALKARLELPPGVSQDARGLIFKMVVLDPNARLGGSDVRDIRAHPFFADAPLPGRGFDGAHRCAAPVLSLEDCCLRRLGRSWARVEAAATEFCAAHTERLREQVHSTVARFRRVRELALKEQARRERQEPLSGSSGEEP